MQENKVKYWGFLNGHTQGNILGERVPVIFPGVYAYDKDKSIMHTHSSYLKILQQRSPTVPNNLILANLSALALKVHMQRNPH